MFVERSLNLLFSFLQEYIQSWFLDGWLLNSDISCAGSALCN